MALLFGNVVFEAHKDGSCTCIVGGSNYPLTRDNMQELKHWLQSLPIRSPKEGIPLGGGWNQNVNMDVVQVAQQVFDPLPNAHN